GSKEEEAHRKSKIMTGDEEDADEELFKSKKSKDKAEKKTVPAGKGGGMLVGTLVGVLLTAGAGAGIWFMQPDLLKSVTKASPNYKEDAPPKVAQLPAVSASQKAHDLIVQGKFAEALDELKDEEKSTANLATRGEARWFKYVKEQMDKNAPPDREHPEVKLAL